jgi:hypothetical protein
MNWRGGLIRCWVVFSVIWLSIIIWAWGGLEYHDFMVRILDPRIDASGIVTNDDFIHHFLAGATEDGKQVTYRPIFELYVLELILPAIPFIILWVIRGFRHR